jgi:AcrR family transcriptional regulator
MAIKVELNEDVRIALLEVARSIFSHFGYNKTTVDEIAKAAGKGKSTFYYYYASKEDIFRDVIELEAKIFRKKLMDSIKASTDPIDKIKNYVVARLSNFKDLVNFYRVFKNEDNTHYRFIEEIRTKYDNEQVGIIKMIFLEAIDLNIIELDSVDLASETVALVLKGLEYNLMFNPMVDKLEEEKIDKIIHLIFNGITKK